MEFPEALLQCARCHKERIKVHDVSKKISEEPCVYCHLFKKVNPKAAASYHRLRYARFDHAPHLNFECEMCHYQIAINNELYETGIIPEKERYYFCARCHPGKKML
jgi:late competence protein required for DNA uptake (superfamily II DNA/RNA helicase)